jgi:hypothetical protein
MGACCAARDKGDFPPFQPAPQVLNNPKILEVEQYAMTLLADPEWEIALEEDDCIVQTRIGSDYNDTLPVVFLEINVKGDFNLAAVSDVMCDPKTRLTWDKDSLADFRLVDDETPDAKIMYSVNKFPWPMKNRDFVDYRYTRLLMDEVRVVFYGIEHADFPVVPGVVRGNTIF